MGLDFTSETTKLLFLISELNQKVQITGYGLAAIPEMQLIPSLPIMDQSFQLLTRIMTAPQNVVLVLLPMGVDGGFTGIKGPFFR